MNVIIMRRRTNVAFKWNDVGTRNQACGVQVVEVRRVGVFQCVVRVGAVVGAAEVGVEKGGGAGGTVGRGVVETRFGRPLSNA